MAAALSYISLALKLFEVSPSRTGSSSSCCYRICRCIWASGNAKDFEAVEMISEIQKAIEKVRERHRWDWEKKDLILLLMRLTWS